jgi:hypothetical protein
MYIKQKFIFPEDTDLKKKLHRKPKKSCHYLIMQTNQAYNFESLPVLLQEIVDSKLWLYTE